MNVGVLLAAGTGRRFNLTKDISHKCMMKVDDVTFLENTLTLMKEVCSEAVVVIGHKHEIIESKIIEISEKINLDTSILFNPVFDSTNNITSMQLALDYILDENLLEDNGQIFYAESDIYFNPDFGNPFVSLMDFAGQGKNVRGTIYTEPHKKEWRPIFSDTVSFTGASIIDYEDRQEEGFAIIGIATFNKTFVLDLSNRIEKVLRESTEDYWDEAERRILKKHKVYARYYTNGKQILEIDDEDDFNYAKKIKINLTI